jgi:RNA polymerase sigma factor (sigma-70 family)
LDGPVQRALSPVGRDRYVRGVTAARESVSTTLEDLVERFGAKIRFVVKRYGLPPAEADEVVQEIRIRLWRAGERGEQIATMPASYIYRTAVSAALDVIKRHRATGASLDEQAERNASPASARPGPEEIAAGSHLTAQVVQVIGELSESRSLAVRLHLAGFELHEIARLSGWSPGRTRNLVYRGLAELRRRLSLRGIGPEVVQ